MPSDIANINRTFGDACQQAWKRGNYRWLRHLADTAIAALQELGAPSARFELYKRDAELALTDEVSL